MKSTNHNTISEDILVVFNEEITFDLAKGLEDENYALSFDESKTLDLLRPLAINKTELPSDYSYLLC